MARTDRFRIRPRDNASKGHISLGEILRELFPLNKVYQEYGYDLVLQKGYKTFKVREEHQDKLMINRARRLKADWVVLDLMLVLEYQGEHHYHAIDYENNPDKAESNYQRRVMLDTVKRIICKEANFFLVEIPYHEKLTRENVSKLIEDSIRSGS
jgi:hypothetical protein